jgi:site-specific DNA-methyltransferase (adenine-specific)
MIDLNKFHDVGYKMSESGTTFSGSHNVHTPRELVEEVLMNIPNLDDGKTFLVLFNVEFVFTLLRTYGVNSSNITFYSDHVNKSDMIEYSGCEVITSLDKNMKFNVVLGNPPYQKDNDNSSFTNLWADFVNSAFDISTSYVAMISPKTWANQVTKVNSSSKVFGLIKKYSEVVNIDECGRHFPKIGSSFSYYVLNKNKSTSGSLVITKNNSDVIDWSIVDFVPNDFSGKTIGIINKILNGDYFDYISSSGTVGDVVNIKDHLHPFSIRFSDGTEKWSDTEHIYQNVKKLVFANQTTRNFPVYAPNSAPANRGVFFKVNDESESDAMLKYFKSPVIRFLISQQRTHHGVLNTSVINRIPKIDLTRDWTDAELYQHFNLNQDEINFIESNVK